MWMSSRGGAPGSPQLMVYKSPSPSIGSVCRPNCGEFMGAGEARSKAEKRLTPEFGLQLRTEAAELLRGELLAELPRRDAERGPEAARGDFRAGEAAGGNDALDQDVAVEERDARR